MPRHNTLLCVSNIPSALFYSSVFGSVGSADQLARLWGSWVAHSMRIVFLFCFLKKLIKLIIKKHLAACSYPELIPDFDVTLNIVKPCSTRQQKPTGLEEMLTIVRPPKPHPPASLI